MSRLRRIEQRDRFFFITTNIAKTVADLRPDERSLILRLLRECRADMGFKIFAYVVMPDHIHMMLEPVANELA